MFAMTSDIRIDRYAQVKANSVTWKSSTGDFTDTCVITLPLAPYVQKNTTTTEHTGGARMAAVETCAFRKDDEVIVRLGYNNDNREVFHGFVARVNFRSQLVLECEGYSYQLRDRYFNKSYQNTTLRKLLKDLISGTDIQLSPRIDDIPLTNVWFKNAPALKVLEWLQKECCCRVFFDGRYLYAGASRYIHADPERGTQEVKLRIGWNVANADDLTQTVSEQVQIQIVEKDPKGQVKKTQSETKKYDNIREIKVRAGMPGPFLKRVAAELQQEQNHNGYEGSITLFGEPHVFKADKLRITDNRFPERSGSYFADTIEGSFGEQGFRRKIKLRRYND